MRMLANINIVAGFNCRRSHMVNENNWTYHPFFPERDESAYQEITYIPAAFFYDEPYIRHALKLHFL